MYFYFFNLFKLILETEPHTQKCKKNKKNKQTKTQIIKNKIGVNKKSIQLIQLCN